MESHHPTLQDSKDVPEEFSDPHHHRALAMDFMVDAYDVFLAGSDSFEAQKQALEARYGQYIGELTPSWVLISACRAQR